jgi:anthranilate synthase component 1
MSLPIYSLDEFLELSQRHRVIPICREVFSGTVSPVSIFEKLAINNPGSFLLESAEAGVWARYSIVGVEMRGRLVQESGGQVSWFSHTGESALPKDLEAGLPESALDAVDLIQRSWHTKLDGMNIPISSGLVGSISWEMISELERLDVRPDQETNCPVVHLSLVRNLVVLDHLDGKVFFISNCFIEGQDSAELIEMFQFANAAIEDMIQNLAGPSSDFLAELQADSKEASIEGVGEGNFLEMIRVAKEHVVRGDVFQVVLSQRFTSELRANPIDVYRALRALNPSPYMYFLNGSDSTGPFVIVGSSPESLVTVNGTQVVTHPIAGSRPRGETAEIDLAYETSLVADAKEVSEHLMLVDLARNDLLKVCEPESVSVSDFKQVHRFSHIMHLVSTVRGKLRTGLSTVDVFRATFPAGTLSGAPKPKALTVINELESGGRGIYGGVCGYFDFKGNADLAIAIRTAFIRSGVASVQAGAGIVLDSDPKSEYLETKHKARAVLRAIELANAMSRIEKS